MAHATILIAMFLAISVESRKCSPRPLGRGILLRADQNASLTLPTPAPGPRLIPGLSVTFATHERPCTVYADTSGQATLVPFLPALNASSFVILELLLDGTNATLSKPRACGAYG